MRYNRYISLILCLIIVATAQAQQSLTLQQCLQMALEHNADIAASNRALSAAQYTAKSYKALFFPSISGFATGLYSNAQGSFSEPGGALPLRNMATGAFDLTTVALFPGMTIGYNVDGIFLGGVSLEQPIYMGGKIMAASEMARLGVKAAGLQKTLTASEVIQQTSVAYAQAVQANEMKQVARTYQQLLMELLANVQSAYRHGLKPQNDVLKVQVKLDESSLQLQKASNALVLAKMNLCHLIGRPLYDDIQLDDVLAADLYAETANYQSVASRPDFALLELKVAEAAQQVKLNRSEMLPKVGLKGTYSYLNGLKINNSKFFDDASYAVLLNVSLPLYHFGERTNKVKAAKAREEQARLEQQSKTQQMELELTRASQMMQEAKMESDLTQQAMKQAEENLRLSRSRYDAGKEPLSDLLEAQMLYRNAQANCVNASFALYNSVISYRKAAGVLCE